MPLASSFFDRTFDLGKNQTGGRANAGSMVDVWFAAAGMLIKGRRLRIFAPWDCRLSMACSQNEGPECVVLLVAMDWIARDILNLGGRRMALVPRFYRIGHRPRIMAALR